jgi:hypothetical protein
MSPDQLDISTDDRGRLIGKPALPINCYCYRSLACCACCLPALGVDAALSVNLNPVGAVST